MVAYSTVTIAPPNGAAVDFSGWTLTGTADQGLAVNDASDATYLDDNATPGIRSYAVYNVANPVIPAGAKIYAVRNNVRVQESVNQPFVAVPANWLGIAHSTTDGQWWDYVNAHPAVPTNYTFGWQTHTPGGAEWTQAFLDALQLVLSVYQQTPTLAWKVYKADFTVAYNERPVATVTAPAEAGTVINTTTPTVTWTYTDPESDPQERFRVKVFSLAQYTAGGFDPETSAATYDSGDVYSSATSHTITTALATTGTYRAYVKAAQNWPLSDHWSAWDNNTFTMAVDGPAVPTITSLVAHAGAAGDGVGPYVEINIAGHDNLLTANQASLETDTTGWTAGSNTTISRTTSQAANGVASLRMDSVAAGDISASNPVGTRPLVTAGVQYTALASFRSAAIPRSARVEINFYDAADVFLSNVAGSNVTTTTTGFTQATVAGTAPANAAKATVIVKVLSTSGAAEVHYVDKVKIAPGTDTAWSRGGLGTSTEYLVEYSTDGGVTWNKVRAVNGGWIGLVTTAGVQTLLSADLEIPTGTTRAYRVTARENVTGSLIQSAPSATSSSSVTFTLWWLKDPFSTGSAMVLGVIAGSLSHGGDQLAFEAIFQTKAEYDAFATLWALNRTMLLQSDMPGQQWFLRFLSDRVGVFKALGRANPLTVADTVNPLPTAQLLPTLQRTTSPVRRMQLAAVTQDRPAVT